MLKLAPYSLEHSLLPAIRSFPSTAPMSFSFGDLKSWYSSSSTDPLHPALLFCGAVSTLVWLLGEVTGNHSHVDRLWTSLPLIYSAHFTFYPLLSGVVSSVHDLDQRMLLVFALQCCWSARLTYQSARRGFLDPRSEDYRWPIVRRALNPLVFKVFNLVFIAFAQNILLLAAELPQYLLLTSWFSSSKHIAALARLKPHHVQGAPVPLNIADALLAVAFLTTLVFEMRADNQQQRFQNLKHAALDKQRKGINLSAQEQKAIERGFVADGLWSWSRHPNFAAEQTTWYLLFAFTVLPFLPVSQSFTSHPISALASLYHPSTLSKLAHHSRVLLTRASTAAPSLDELLTSLSHPLSFLRVHASDPVGLAKHAVTSAPTAKLAAQRAYRHAITEVKADEGIYWNYSIVAPLSMSALFYASTWLTERISAGKYPLYKTYQARVSKFWPALTPLKGLWLALTVQRGKVDRKIWGESSSDKRKNAVAKGKKQ
ncbi:hypothetical protein JCM10207_001591 [Rhodosporidiobolus poonsookiae]